MLYNKKHRKIHVLICLAQVIVIRTEPLSLVFIVQVYDKVMW